MARRRLSIVTPSLNQGVPAERAVFLRRRIIDRVGPLEESPPFAARVIGGFVRAALENRE